MPKSGERTLAASSMGMPPTTSSVGMTEKLGQDLNIPLTVDTPPPNQRGHVSVREIPSTTEHRVVSPISTGHILGKGAAIFTDMTETMLTTLDQQMAYQVRCRSPKVL